MDTVWIVAALAVCVAIAALVWAVVQRRTLLAQLEALRSERDTLREQIAAAQARETALAEAQAAARKEREAQTAQQIALLREQWESTAQRLLRERQAELEKTNHDTMGQIVTPLREEIGRMNDLIHRTKEGQDKNSASIERALHDMVARSEQLGRDANNLADALKNRGKVHGDWGEQVLTDILQGSGLREGIEFSTQASYHVDRGNILRPDVVVHCPDGSHIIVDAKVSLTAYADYVGAANEEERRDAQRRNYESVWRHVRELADKHYPDHVEGAIGHVLMFVPNEGSYILAMNHHPALAQEAFRQGIVIVNPTNLMLTLHLVLQTWQNTRQEDNCRQIINVAKGAYEKMVGVVDTCIALGAQLDTVQKTYHTAINQLSEGQGNLYRRLDTLRQLGVQSTKRPRQRRTATPLDTPLDPPLDPPSDTLPAQE